MNWRSILKRVGFPTGAAIPPVSLFLIGTQKAGTSFLHQFLAAHPQLQGGREKELHFFDQDIAYQKGLDHYHSRFRPRAGAVYFESTPKYLFNPKCAERIFRYNPDAKFVAILRDPVERAYSAWNMYRRLYSNPESMVFDPNRERDSTRLRYAMRFRPGGEQYGSFESVIREEMDLISRGDQALLEGPDLLRRGFYADQLDRYRKLFPRDALLLLSFKNLCRDPATAFDAVCKFAEVPIGPPTLKETTSAHNVGAYGEALRPEDQALLGEVFAKHDDRLQRDHGFTIDW